MPYKTVSKYNLNVYFELTVLCHQAFVIFFVPLPFVKREISHISAICLKDLFLCLHQLHGLQ